jgi:hypothetical protein
MLSYFFPAFEKQAISTHKNLVLGFYIPCSQGKFQLIRSWQAAPLLFSTFYLPFQGGFVCSASFLLHMCFW